jgi:hypothetical protein
MTDSFPLAATDYFRVRARALAFARHSREEDLRLEVIRVSKAPREEVEQFGTPSSAVYSQVFVRTQNSPRVIEEAVRRSGEQDASAIRTIWESPFDHRIVCSATNVIHHEVLYCDLLDEIGPVCDVATSAPPVFVTDMYAPICGRALQFVRWQKRYSNADLLQIGPAHGAEIERWGTPGSDLYGEVILRLQHSPEHVARMVALETRMRNGNPDQVRDILARPRGLRVVCTATDVVHYEWLRLA